MTTIHVRWERVNDTEVNFTERLSVPGGWLYRFSWKDADCMETTMCFVPNPLDDSKIR